MILVRFLLVLSISVLTSQAYAQGFNKANSGREAVEGFLKTVIAKHSLGSDEIMSYLLPSFRDANYGENVNMYNAWRYIVDKTEDNIVYVAVYTTHLYKSNCKLIAFETQQENGHWYIVPSGMHPLSDISIQPWVMCSRGTNYVPGSGPFEIPVAPKEVKKTEAKLGGVNQAKSGREVVDGFLKTVIAKHAIDSKEMLSYILPSYGLANPHDKVNMYQNTWKYKIEKTRGNVFYVAVYTEPDYKHLCKLMTFQTKEENGTWYLVPRGLDSYDKSFVDPWAICSETDVYVPETGPYGTPDNPLEEQTAKLDASDKKLFENLALIKLEEAVQVALDEFEGKQEVIHDKILPAGGDDFYMRLGQNQKCIVAVFKAKSMTDNMTYVVKGGMVNGVSVLSSPPKIELFRYDERPVVPLDGGSIFKKNSWRRRY